MAADSQLKLPGNFEAGKSYWISGETMIAWRKALLADRVLPGPGIKESQTPMGRTFTATAQDGGGGSSASGAFATVFQAGGKWYLQDGSVSGGTGSESVAATDLELSDVGSEPADDEELWLKIQGTAVLTDGVLTSAFNVTGVTVQTTGGSNNVPTVSSTSGTYYHKLGSWLGGTFRPTSGSGGNLRLEFCPPSTFRLS
jgi:hypothetical protein